METFFGFASSLNRNLSTTIILLETVFLLANSLRNDEFYPEEVPRFFRRYKPSGCIYVDFDTLKCSNNFETRDSSEGRWPYPREDRWDPWEDRWPRRWEDRSDRRWKDRSYRRWEDRFDPHWEGICLIPCDSSDRRGPTVRLSGRGISKIDSSAPRCMKCIEELYLSSNSLELKSGDFHLLSELRTFILSKNIIKSLKNSTFRGLNKLEVLFLDFNQIQSIPIGLFDDLGQLRELNLEGNQLEALNYQILSPLTKLKYLNLKNNKLRSLADTFKKDRMLEVLHLSSNSNLSLESDTFEGLKLLKELYINDCKITSFPINLFQDMQGLRQLFINNNHLREVSFEIFGNLTSLSHFYATSNNISVLRDKPFKYHRNLTEIELTRNSLVYINESDLEGLSSLKVLRLPLNSIEYISQRSFKDMPLLETLDLKRNKIKTLFSFENNTQLKSIDISYNQLTIFLFTGLEKLSLLQKFDVSNNAIKNLSIPMLIPPTSPSTIPKFLFERNKIEKIMFMNTSKSLNSLSWNFSVNLEGNPLVCDCHMYDLYRYLINNRLSPVKFEDSIMCPFENKPIKTLKNDYFKCNIEDSCPYNCKCVYRASNGRRSVDCAKGNYTSLPVEIPPDIHVLYISHNNLSSLANLKEPCWENLTELHSDSNEITFEEFSIPRNLTYLGLKDNKLEALPEVIRKHAETSKNFKMTLSNNLWRCDCWVLHLKLFLSTYGNQVVDTNSIRCTFANGTVSFFNLISMSDSDLCPDIDLYVFVIGFMLLILCVYILHRRYKLRISEVWNTECPPHMRNTCCCRLKRRDKMRVFDCFLSYCLEDKSVVMAIVQEMNRKEPRYIFCTHERNWTPYCQVTNSISFSIPCSRSVLVVLSKKFAKSEWFHMEFRRAINQLRNDKKFKLILVIVGDTPDKNELPENVQFFLSSGMYLKFGEKWFWHKLREAFRSLDTVVKLNIPEEDESL